MELRYIVIVICFSSISIGCASMTDPPVAFIGQPAVYDGSRLFQEQSQRRLQIENEIRNAKVSELETSARIFRGSTLSAGLDVDGTKVESEIAALIAADNRSAADSTNSTVLQNAYLESIKSNLVQEQANAENQQIIRDSALQSQNALIEYHIQILNDSDSKPEDKKNSADVLKLLLAGQAPNGVESDLQLPASGATASVESGTNTAEPTSDLSATLTEAASQLKAASVAISASAAQQAALAQVPATGSTRREQFQQYQAYLDELYSFRNRYLLDDSHRLDGRRIVRLVFPIYVPPSRSSQTTEIEFTLSPDNSIDKGNADLKRYAIVDALNYLVSDIDELGRRLSVEAMQADYRRVARAFHGLKNCVGESYDIGEGFKRVFLKDLDAPRTPADHKLIWKYYDVVRKIGLKKAAAQCTALYLRQAQTDNQSEAPDGKINKTDSLIKTNFSSKMQLVWLLPKIKIKKTVNDTPNLSTSNSFRVFAQNPVIEREKVDQTISRIRSVSASLGVKIGNMAERGTIGIGGSILDQLVAQSASISPVIAAVQNGKPHSFGWHVYPRWSLSGSKKLVKQHVGTNFNASVDISVPLESKGMSVTYSINGAQNGLSKFSINIPPATYEEVFASITTFPTTYSARDYGIVPRDKPLSIFINGDNLWRNPAVHVGGRSADTLEFVAGSESLLRATFNNLKGVVCDYFYYNYKRQNKYRGETLTKDTDCAASIWVSTTEGRDFAGSIVLKTKAKPAVAQTPKLTGRIERVELSSDQIIFNWTDVANNAYAKSLKKGTRLIVLDKERGIQQKLSFEKAMQDGEKAFSYRASGLFNTGFCTDDGTNTQAGCIVELKIEKISIAAQPINIANNKQSKP